MNRQIILASTSPRRKQLLGLFGVKFKVVNSGYKEVLNQKLPHKKLVKFLAMGKARAAAKKYPKAVIIAADTIVSFQNRALGKPKNQRDARKMLTALSGKMHFVISGVVVLDAKSGKFFLGTDTAKVFLRELSPKDIENYIASGEPFDKAGAYGFMGKGMNLIEKIDGDLTTDLGMPIGFVFNSLQKLGVKI